MLKDANNLKLYDIIRESTVFNMTKYTEPQKKHHNFNNSLFNMTKYTEPQKKHHNFNNSLRYGKHSMYFFSLNYKFLLQHKMLVLITKVKQQ